MEPSAEREALAALLDSEGWRLFRERVDRDFGAEAVCQQVDALYVREEQEHRDLEHERRALALTTRKIQALLRWPRDRLAELKQQAQPKSLNPFAGRSRA